MTTTVARLLGRENSEQLFTCQVNICADLSRTHREDECPQLRRRGSVLTTADAGCSCRGTEHRHRRFTSFRLPRRWQHELRLDD